MRILFVGPIAPPVHGQSLSFKFTNEIFNDCDKNIVDTIKTRNKFVNVTYVFCSLVFLLLTKKYDKIYFTCSRTIVGFLRELPLFILKRKNTLLINHLHGADFKNFIDNSGLFKKLIVKCYEKVDISIVLMTEMLDQFEGFNRMKVVVVPNNYAFDFEDDSIQFVKNNEQILYLSNLIYSKGITYFLDAAETLLRTNDNITIKIAGRILPDNFKSIAEMQNIFNTKLEKLQNHFGKRVEFLGVVTGVEKIQLLFESSIFVLPSFYISEAFPISIIEAMRAGNYIITTDHNYLSNLINSTQGDIIPIKNHQAISNAILNIINDKDRLLDIHKNNIIHAQKLYSPRIYEINIKKLFFEH